MARRRRHAEGHENSERWLLTYSDMITLLMAFFIMLYGMSQLDIQKFQAMAGAVQAELGGAGVLEGGSSAAGMGGTTVGTLSPDQPETDTGSSVIQLSGELKRDLVPVGETDGIEVMAEDGAVRVRVPSSTLMFPAGSATLTPAMAGVMGRIGAAMARYHCAIRAEGHTCNLPVRYGSNWDLSADRARNAALWLVRNAGIAPDDVSTMGYADTRPLQPNATEAGRWRNRRVEFILKPWASSEAAGDHGWAADAGVGPAPGGLAVNVRPAPVKLMQHRPEGGPR